MFPSRYFPAYYYPPRYFPRDATTITDAVGAVTGEGRLFSQVTCGISIFNPSNTLVKVTA